MEEALEVVVLFSQGRIIPRRIRYYDLPKASYDEKDIAEIFYEVRDLRGSRYGIQFSDGQTGILHYNLKTGLWQLISHL